MGNKNLFSSKDGNKIRNLICLCNRWNPKKKKEIRGKGVFNYGTSRNQKGNNIWSSNCSVLERKAEIRIRKRI
jgi:hypothetical protein